jgi:hypothetical protein
MFLTADGESGKAGGNETIRVDAAGRLRIKVPAALADELGTHLEVADPVWFAHRGEEWLSRVLARHAVRYDISYDPKRGRWYLDASWKATQEQTPALEKLQAGRVLGVDLNADHLALCVLDASGNPVGDPITIDVVTAGLAASHRDGRVRAAITAMLNHAEQLRCAAVVVENLNFADARAAGRGRGFSVIGVDAAYTSKWGAQHWRTPLQQQTSDPVTRHHAAAVAIGRRGLDMAIKRRPAGPRTGQRTAAGTPPARPDHHPSVTRGCRSSGPPTHPPRGVPVHQTTPTRRGQHRSGRTGLTPAQ